ncbi:hypothetical protein Btru_075995 [Bulinus truncatus]|nr:hypothetical protein Btru_075995 [Bulinus truncatus]
MGEEMKVYSDDLIMRTEMSDETDRTVLSSNCSGTVSFPQHGIVKTRQQTDEPTEINPEFQSLEEAYKQGIPAYSILLLRPSTIGDDPGGESDQFIPLISKHSEPLVQSKVQSLCLSQHDNPSAINGINESAFDSLSQANGNIHISSQQMDPLWLQFLSNIVSKQSKAKQAENSASGVCPNVAYLVPKSLVTQMGMTSDMNDASTAVENGGKDELVGRTNPVKNISRQLNQSQNVSVKLPQGQLILLSPMSNCPDSQVILSQSVHPSLTQSNKAVNNGYINLNSSGEESQQPSPISSDIHFSAKHEPAMSSGVESKKLTEYNIPLASSSPLIEHDRGAGPMRESHNMKERRRRARIKEACNLMRQLVPGMSKKTDKATVFEFSARYIHFLKSFVGTNNDKDFLVKYNPY